MFKRFLKLVLNCIPVKKGLYLFSSNPYRSDNSLVLFNFLSASNLKGVKLKWVKLDYNLSTSRRGKPFFGFRRFIRRILSIYFISRAEKVFFTHQIPFFPEKKHQALYLLWHGTPFKKFDGRLISNINHKNLFFVAPSKFSLAKYAETNEGLLDLNRCLCYRHFRTDRFLSPNIDHIKSVMALAPYKHVILGCFTWRREHRNLDTEFDILPMFEQEFLKDLDVCLKMKNDILLIKPHPMQKIALKGHSPFTNIKFIYDEDLAKAGINLYDFLAASDALLSDYSSIVFDYCLLQKPIGHVLLDFDEFSKNAEEGVIYEDPKDYLPGTILKTQDQVKSFIETIGEWKPTEHYRKITMLFNDTERVSESSSEKFCQSELFLTHGE